MVLQQQLRTSRHLLRRLDEEDQQLRRGGYLTATITKCYVTNSSERS